VDITVYLPDDVAQRAKARSINLSRVLRDALTAQFSEEDAVEATLGQAASVTLELRTDDGRAYRGRMEAALLGESAHAETAVYLRRTGEVVAYRAEDRSLRTVADPASELFAVLPTDRYFAAMDALGLVPEIDLDAVPSGLVARQARGSQASGSQAPVRSTGRRLRSVPGDIVEPPVAFLRRLTGHGDLGRDSVVVAEVPSSPGRVAIEGAGDTTASADGGTEAATEAPAEAGDDPVAEPAPER
jgi:hypothetical protein